MLIVPFLLLGAAFYGTWLFVLDTYRPHKKETWQRRALAIIVTSCLVVCAGLQSLGELAPRDFIIVTLLAAVSYFYIVRASSTRT